MSHMHVFCDIWWWKIDQHGVFFLLWFSLFKLDNLLLIDVSNLLMNEIVLQEDVQEEARFIIWTFSNFAKLNFLDRGLQGILRDIVNDGSGHFFAIWETERSLFLIFVEKLHGGSTLVVPVLILLWVHLKSFSEFRHCSDGCFLQNLLQVFRNRYHYF